MYKIIFENKENSFEQIKLEYELWMDASAVIETVFAGDLKNKYKCTINIAGEEEDDDVDR